MPTYTYQCPDCEHVFDTITSISNRDGLVNTECPECNKSNLKRIQVAPPTIVAGIGETTKLMSNGWKDVIKGVRQANPNNTMRDY